MHFILPRHVAWLVDALPTMRLGAEYPYWLGGRVNWVAQSYLVLRAHRDGLTLGTAPRPGRINLAHGMTWRDLGPRQGEFRLAFRADYPRLFDVDFDVVQNPCGAPGPGRIYLPYWPVPGLIPRDPARRGLRRVAYAGRIGPANLAKGVLADLDLEVIPPHRWHDLSQVDLLVAVRSLDRRRHGRKPPSKLFSAWRGNIPLIAGWDSAFSAVGVPGRDYLRVASARALQEAVEHLREDRAAYDRIVAAGQARAEGVTTEAVAQVWLDALDGPVARRFEAWRDSPARVAPLLDRLRGGLSRARQAVAG